MSSESSTYRIKRLMQEDATCSFRGCDKDAAFSVPIGLGRYTPRCTTHVVISNRDKTSEEDKQILELVERLMKEYE